MRKYSVYSTSSRLACKQASGRENEPLPSGKALYAEVKPTGERVRSPPGSPTRARTKALGFRVFSPVARLAIPCENKRRLQAGIRVSSLSCMQCFLQSRDWWCPFVIQALASNRWRAITSRTLSRVLACRSRLHLLGSHRCMGPLCHPRSFRPIYS